MKNIIKLLNYYLPWEVEKEICLFVSYSNHERVHEFLDNMTLADGYCGRYRQIQEFRDMVKEKEPRFEANARAWHQVGSASGKYLLT